MLSSKTRDELLTLLDALVNETITTEEHRRLESLLLADAEARELFWQYLGLHCQLRQLAQSWAEEKLLRLTEAIESGAPSPSPMSTPDSPRPGLIYGVILSLLVGFAAGVLWFRHLTAENSVLPSGKSDQPTTTVSQSLPPPDRLPHAAP
ncbi:hypothetical protein [Thermogutta sp.]|uniref:hypothetical protein n=1 Tax=Thermogutta sp. TaxID=1962930 RepID=UPI003C7B5980